jgi:hypothetical protein
MLNSHAIETEAAFRRHEWQQAVEADARAAQARPASGLMWWPRISHLWSQTAVP